MYDEDTINTQDWHLKQGGIFVTPLANPYYGWSHSLSGITAAQLENALVEPKWPPRFVRKLFGIEDTSVDPESLKWSLNNFRPSQQVGRTTYGVVNVPGGNEPVAVECSRPCLSELRTWASVRILSHLGNSSVQHNILYILPAATLTSGAQVLDRPRAHRAA